MKRKITALLLCLILCFTAAALYGCLPLTYEQERIGPAMWIVTDKDGHRCYLFGTVHTAKNGNMYPFADVIEDAYSYCDYLATEADVTKSGDENSLKYYEYTDGTTVKDHISEEVYSKAVEKITEYEGSYNGQYDKYNISLWYSLIDGYNTEKSGYSAEYGADTYFINKAKSDGKPVVEIEGEAKQAEMTASIPDTVMEYFLSSALQSSGSASLDYYDAIYQSGSIELLSYSLNSGKNAQYNASVQTNGIPASDRFKEYVEIMITDRNKALADAVIKCLTDGDRVFFAIGLTHLCGDDGVVSILQSSGCRVIRK